MDGSLWFNGSLSMIVSNGLRGCAPRFRFSHSRWLTLHAFGSLKSFGFARLLWFTRGVWLTPGRFGSLDYFGFAPLCWFTLLNWLTLGNFGSRRRPGFRAILWVHSVVLAVSTSRPLHPLSHKTIAMTPPPAPVGSAAGSDECGTSPPWRRRTGREDRSRNNRGKRPDARG